MSPRVCATVLALVVSTARWTSAQSVVPSELAAPSAIAAAPDATSLSTARGVGLPAPLEPGAVTFGAPSPVNPFTSIGHDLKTFFTSKDTRIVLGAFVPAAGVAYAWDQEGVHESQEHLKGSAFQAGTIGGSFFVQAGAAVGTWAIGSISDHRKTAEIGGDLLRAQIVSQAVVQGIKFATHRERPDGSNYHSFPSGHTASAFATASVLNRHLGWKAGVPAYGFATFVGLSRMSANKHHMSDVIMGAAMGIAAGRAVTVGVGGAQFDLGVAPTKGGAAVTFTRR
jgi:membrane-associated phospholipid phosphatase